MTTQNCANIDSIQAEIDRVFCKNKIPALTKSLPMENLQIWAGKVAKHFNLDEEEFRQVVTELFWSMANVQLSIGHSLIAMQECEFINGAKGIALKDHEVPDIKMPEIYFWYHVSNAYECMYRCWERMNNVIKQTCFPNLPEDQLRKMYLPQTISKLKGSSQFNQNPCLNDLENQIQFRKKVSDVRNQISHGKSSPMRNMKIEGKASNLLGADGLPFIYLDYSSNSLKQQVDNVVERYKEILPGMKAAKDFIDNI